MSSLCSHSPAFVFVLKTDKKRHLLRGVKDKLQRMKNPWGQRCQLAAWSLSPWGVAMNLQCVFVGKSTDVIVLLFDHTWAIDPGIYSADRRSSNNRVSTLVHCRMSTSLHWSESHKNIICLTCGSCIGTAWCCKIRQWRPKIPTTATSHGIFLFLQLVMCVQWRTQ